MGCSQWGAEMSALDDIIARDSAPQQASPLDAIIARDGQVAAPAQPQAAPAPQPAQPAQPWQTPGALTMGAGDAVRGYGQSIVHGLSWLADKVAPDSQFAKDARAALPQIQTTIDTQNAQYAKANPDAGMDWKRLAGQAGGMALLGGGGLSAPESLAGKALVGALSGVAGSAAQPVTDLQPGQTYADQKLDQIKNNALVGALAGPATAIAGKAISGAGGAAQQQLAKAGVTMTPGQILGGAAARTEEKLSSVPVLGDLIKGAQQRAANSFNTATYNEVLAPLGVKYSGPIGHEGVEAVQRTISDAYDSTLSKMQFKIDQPFMADLQQLGGMAQNLPAQQQQTFANVVKTQIIGKFGPQGNMDGDTLKGVQSELGRMARGYAGDPSFDNRQLGEAIGALKDAVDNALPRSNTPELAQQLQKANAAYANFVRLRTAAGSQGAMNNGGVFTAAQLNNAVRQADKSAGKGASATGNALMQDLSGAGQQVLGSKYPDSGTAGRAMLGLAASAAAGHALLPAAVAGPAAVVGSAAALPYTKYGQALAQALLMSRPAGAVPVGNALSRYGVPFSAALGSALLPAIAGGQ
jgi:hypothetical protein